MDEKVLQLRVGFFVLVALIVTGILIMLFSDGLQSTYTVMMEYPAAPGVTVGTPVRKNGIRIGRISQVSNETDRVILTAKIETKSRIYKSEVAQLGSASILGDAVIEIVPGNTPFDPTEVAAGTYVPETSVKGSPLDALQGLEGLQDDVKSTLASFQNTSNSINAAAQDVQEFTRSLQSVVGDDQGDVKEFFRNMKNLSSKADTAVDNFNVAMENINDIFGDENLRLRLQESFDKLPQIFEQAEKTLAEVQTTVADFRNVSSAMENNLRNLEGLTQPIGEQGEELVNIVKTGLVDVDELVKEVRSFANKLNRSEGSLGLLMNDRELYDQLVLTLKNVEETTRRLKPIVNDARVLVDKVSRDPSGSIGLRSMFDRRPNGGAIKGTLLGQPPGFTTESPGTIPSDMQLEYEQLEMLNAEKN
jgi:phospholipid/cholesterol/gamma-HCH transport system substrate-binding protein